MQQNSAGDGRLIRVLVAANSIVVQTGLATLLSASPGLNVVGTSSLSALSEWAESLRPDVVLLEWDASDDDRVLLPPALAPAIVMLVDDWQRGALADLLRAGVRGVLPSDATASEIVRAVEAVSVGLTVLHPEGVESLLPPLAATARPVAEPGQALTTREVEVLTMLAEGLGNKTIARRLGISEHTVKFHIGSIFSKLKASSRTEAVILGARQGLILL